MAGSSERERIKDCIALALSTDDMDTILHLSRDSSPLVRRAAVAQLCPCRVQRDVSAFWARVFEMAHDEDDAVRAKVLHILCDGSPSRLEVDVVSTIERTFNRDTNRDIRRRAHKVLASYKSTGRWNIL